MYIRKTGREEEEEQRRRRRKRKKKWTTGTIKGLPVPFLDESLAKWGRRQSVCARQRRRRHIDDDGDEQKPRKRVYI